MKCGKDRTFHFELDILDMKAEEGGKRYWSSCMS